MREGETEEEISHPLITLQVAAITMGSRSIPGTRSLVQFYLTGDRDYSVGRIWLPSPSHSQGNRKEMEQLGHELVPIWGTAIAGSSLTVMLQCHPLREKVYV